MLRAVFCFLFLLLASTFALAHELRPAFLSITQIGEAEYSILWKTPALGEKQLALKANFPDSCTASNGQRRVEQDKFAVETWTLTCSADLRGQSLRIGGLDKTLTDVLVRTNWLGESGQDDTGGTARLTPDNTRLDFAAQPSRGGTAKTYFALGVGHILSGVDHLLFIFAVMMLLTGRKKLFLAVTAFTIGHSITLALATLNIVRIDPALVETLIAMSIVLMAYEGVGRLRGRSGLTQAHPWLVTFMFGLLHGFGFAGALRALGLPQGDIPAALLFFNVGVEVGQIIFISLVLGLLSLPVLRRLPHDKRAVTLASYAVGTVAVYWTIARGVSLFGALLAA